VKKYVPEQRLSESIDPHYPQFLRNSQDNLRKQGKFCKHLWKSLPNFQICVPELLLNWRLWTYRCCTPGRTAKKISFRNFYSIHSCFPSHITFRHLTVW